MEKCNRHGSTETPGTSEFIWTRYAIKRYGKRNDAGEWRREEKTRKTKKEMNEIQERTEMSLEELGDATSDKKRWREVIISIARAQRVEGTG